MAVPSVVSTSKSATSGGCNVTQLITLGAGLSIVVITTEAQDLPASGSTVINDPTSGWTRIVGGSGNAGLAVAGQYLYVFRKVTTNGETINTGDSGVFQVFQAITVSGYDAASPIEALATGSDTASASGVYTVPSLTTAGADRLVIGFVNPRADLATAIAGTWTNSGLASLTGMTTQQTNLGSGGGLAAFHGGRTAAGAVGATTIDASAAGYDSAAYGYATFAIKPSFTTHTAAASVAGAGTVAASGTRKALAAASVSGAGSLTASVVRKALASAEIQGTGGVNATAGVTRHAAASVEGAGSVSAEAFRETLAAAAVSGEGAIAASGTRTALIAAGVAGAGAIAAAAIVPPREGAYGWFESVIAFDGVALDSDIDLTR